MHWHASFILFSRQNSETLDIAHLFSINRHEVINSQKAVCFFAHPVYTITSSWHNYQNVRVLCSAKVSFFFLIGLYAVTVTWAEPSFAACNVWIQSLFVSVTDAQQLALAGFFSTRVINMWNNLPVDTTDFSSLRKFCASHSKDYLLTFGAVNFMWCIHGFNLFAEHVYYM